MHGTLHTVNEPPPSKEKFVVDPVCRMTIDPTTAAASEMFEGDTVYFCSQDCRERFLADPYAYRTAVPAAATGAEHHCCSGAGEHNRQRPSVALLGVPAGVGLLASALMLGMYFAVLSLVSGWPFTVDQFVEWWPYIVALATGFGIQVGLFVHLRRLHAAASGKVIAATGGASGAAMVSCCTHYLVNVLPVLGATGLVSFVGAYQVELFWFGIASNLAGITYIGRRVLSSTHGA